MLLVFAGRPGTGKTTLAGLLAAELRAAVVRVDAVEAAIVRSGLAAHPLGPVGYVVAHEVAAGCLRAGTPVVVDAVNPVAEARAGWTALAAATGVPLRVVEVEVSDAARHRHRVEQRRSDLPGLAVPTWEQVTGGGYQPWDEARDGPRLLVDNVGEPADAAARIRAYLADGRSPGEAAALPELAGERVVLAPVTPTHEPELRRIRHTPQVRQRWGDEDDPAWPFDDPSTTRFAVLLDGEVRGLVQYAEEDDPAYRHASIDVFVDPAVHGRGVGRDAVRTLARHLVRDRGHHRLVIDPAADNAAAIRCYTAVGFRPVGVLRRYERDADGRGWHDGLLMDALAEDLTRPPA